MEKDQEQGHQDQVRRKEEENWGTVNMRHYSTHKARELCPECNEPIWFSATYPNGCIWKGRKVCYDCFKQHIKDKRNERCLPI